MNVDKMRHQLQRTAPPSRSNWDVQIDLQHVPGHLRYIAALWNAAALRSGAYGAPIEGRP